MKTRRVATAGAAIAATILTAVGLNSLQSNDFGGVVTEIPATQELIYTIDHQDVTSAPQAISLVRGKLLPHVGAGFVLTPKGREPSKVRNLAATMEAVKRNLAKPPTVRFTIDALKDGYVLRAAKVDADPKAYMATNGTDAVDIIVGTTVARFPSVQSLGIFNCRKIAGSSSWSQHAWANAVDFDGSTQLLDKIAKDLFELVKNHNLPATQILWRGRNLLSGNPVSGHYDHIHVTGDPVKTGVPPCA